MTTLEIVNHFCDELSDLSPSMQIRGLKLLAQKLAYELEPDAVEDICFLAMPPIEERVANAMVRGFERRNEERVSWEGVR